MTTDTLTLPAFLLAQIEADEVVARAAIDAVGGDQSVARLPPETYEHVVNWAPFRVLADVAAKRAIVELHEVVGWQCVFDEDGSCEDEYESDDCKTCFESSPCPTLRALAQPYAGCEGWNEAWAI